MPSRYDEARSTPSIRQHQTLFDMTEHETLQLNRSSGEEQANELLVLGRFAPLASDASSRANSTLGVDNATQDQVVITSVDTTKYPSGTILRLEHQASLLVDVRVESLSSMLAIGRHEQTLYLVQDQLPEVALAQHLRDHFRLGLLETLAIGRSVLRALEPMHERGVVHGEVHPRTVHIDSPGPIKCAVLATLGPPKSLEASAHSFSDLARLAVHMSPEQAGSIDCDVGEASDLYSVGILLYQCLTGRPPFEGKTVNAVLFQHMTAPVPPLRTCGIDAPRVLEEVIQRLLRKDPRDRYQTAAAVLADLEVISAAVSQGQSNVELVVGAQDRRCTLTEPAFVARAAEVRELESQVADTQRGSGDLVLLEGKSGDGKSRVLVEAARLAAANRLLVLRGQGSNEVAVRPFRLLEGVIDGFIAAARTDANLLSRVRERLKPHQSAIRAVSTALADVLGWTDELDALPEAFAEIRCVRALIEFLDALGSVQRPAFILLDDCQWADDLTSKLIAKWRLTPPEQSHRFTSLIVAFRSEEADADHWLRQVEPRGHLKLAPFKPTEIGQLIESMAGPLPAEVTQLVVRLAEGSPFMACAVLRGLVESGALLPVDGGWRVEPFAMEDLCSSDHAAAILSRRIELLPERTTYLLSIGAILGKEFELDVVAQLARDPAAHVIVALDEARDRNLIWMRSDGSSYVFFHDRIRTSLLDRLSVEERRELHRSAAESLQTDPTAEAAELAYHFDAAGDSKSALPYAICAAETARRHHSLEIAEEQYRIAQRGSTGEETAMHYKIAVGLGDVLMLRGRYDEAAGLFERAAEFAEGEFAKIQIRGKLAELLFKRGDMEEATARFEQALQVTGTSIPRRSSVVLLMLLWEATVQICAHPLAASLRSPQETGSLLDRSTNVASIQWPGPWSLVRSLEDVRALGAPTWFEFRRTLCSQLRARACLC